MFGWFLGWFRRTPRSIAPHEVPGHYVVKWTRGKGDTLLYKGTDTGQARRHFLSDVGVPGGARVELYDGPHRRGERLVRG